MPRDLLRSNGNGGNDPDESLISNNTVRRDDDESREEKTEVKEQTPPRNKLPAQLPKKTVGPPIMNKPGQPFRPSQAVEAQMVAEEEARVQSTLDPKLTSAPTSAIKNPTVTSSEDPIGLPAALPRPGPPGLARGLPKPNAFSKRPPAPVPTAQQPNQETAEDNTPLQADLKAVQEEPIAQARQTEEGLAPAQTPHVETSEQESTPPQPNPNADQDATQGSPLEAEDDESKPKTGFGLSAPKPVFRPPTRPAGPPGARPGGAPARPAGPPPRPGGAPVPRKPPM